MGAKKAKRNRFDLAGAKNAKTLTWDDFATQFKPKLHKPFARAKDQLTPILLFASKKTVLEGDLVLDCTTPNVVVQGDLVVRGNVVMMVDEGFGTFLWVTGNLEADCISLEGFPELFVGGRVECRHGIVGIRGDDGGYLDVLGDVKAPVVVADSYFNMKLQGSVDGIVVNTSQRTLKADYTQKNVRKALKAELFEEEADEDDEDSDEDESLNSEAVRDAIESGTAVLRPEVKRTRK